MIIQNIVNRLRAKIGQFTDDFSDIQAISTLTQSSGTITATTATNHNLTTGDYILIRGAKEPISLSSLTRSGSIVTAVAATDSKLIDPSAYGSQQLPIYIEISGATPSQYNGTFELLSVSTDGLTFTYKISTTPSSPASVPGTLLLRDYDGYNGLKQITVTSATEFTYTTSNSALQSPSQGNIELSKASRIDGAATPQRILDFYSANDSLVLKNWMFVVGESAVAYRNDTVASDLSSATRVNQDYYYTIQNNFSIYTITPAKTSITGLPQYDLSVGYLPYILKSIGNYQFSSGFTDPNNQPCYLVGHEPDDYIKAYYTHRFDFSAESLIQSQDTVDFNPGRPLVKIDGDITDKDLEFKPTVR